MTSPYDQNGRAMINMEARVGSGGQILTDNMTGVANQSNMHTLQPVVVDSGWSSLMSMDPSTGQIVPTLNAMMMMMMPQAGAQYPVMFTSSQPMSLADKMTSEGFTHMMSMAGNTQPIMGGHSTIDVKQLSSLQGNADSWMKPNRAAGISPVQVAESKGNPQESEVKHPNPPKRPLSAYMRFSKQVWVSVKEANPGLSVCEIGSIIGRLWRELSDAEKKSYSLDFEQAKSKYDVEIKGYLQMTGLKSSDLNKPKATKKKEPASNNKKTPAQPAVVPKVETHAHNGVAPGQNWSGNQQEVVLNRNMTSAPSATSSLIGQQQQSLAQTSSVHGMKATGNRPDGMVVFHMTDDGNSECYVERGQTVAEVKTSNAPDYQHAGSTGHNAGMMQTAESNQLSQATNVAELIRTVNELREELTKAYRCINELRQENGLLRQMHEAQIPMR